jgi:hypothetical protein
VFCTLAGVQDVLGARHMKTLVISILMLAACDKSEPGKAPSTKPRDMVAERAAIENFRKRACECTDRTCADKVADDLKAYMVTDRGVAPEATKEEADRDLAVLTEFIKCLDKARGVSR